MTLQAYSLFCILFLSVAAASNSPKLITKSFIKDLKSKALFEVAEYESNIFKDWTLSDLISADTFARAVPDDLPESEVPASAPSPPMTIDWREQAPDCIHPIRTMGQCSSGSYAFAVAGVLSDRCCLATKNDPGWLSVQELFSCDKKSYGCAGGWALWSANYTLQNGLVHEGCYPYSGRSEDCPNQCKDGYSWDQAHKCKGKTMTLIKDLDGLKKMLVNGPVAITFEAFDDFFNYKSGVYCFTTGKFRKLLTGRVVALNETATPAYMTVAMPFGTKFGESGYVKFCTTCCGLYKKYEKGNVAVDF